MIKFEKLDLQHKDLYFKYTNKKYINSEASFTNMFIWRKSIDAHIAIVSDMLVLKVNFGGKTRFLMPFGDDINIKSCVHLLHNYSIDNGFSTEIIGANENFVKVIEQAGILFSCEEMRDARDYVYSAQNLASLSGKKLHSKKNHVNKFKKSYCYTINELKNHNECILKTEEWMYRKYDGDTKKYSNELETVRNLFDNYDMFDLIGLELYVDGNLVAYTVGEELTENTALIHIEKADIDYNGAFAVINNEFAKILSKKYKYINREEDMGIEGIRKAKESYKPEFLTEKYRLIIK